MHHVYGNNRNNSEQTTPSEGCLTAPGKQFRPSEVIGNRLYITDYLCWMEGKKWEGGGVLNPLSTPAPAHYVVRHRCASHQGFI